MTMTAQDPLHGKARGDSETAIAVAESHGARRLDEVRAYLREVFYRAPQVGLDPAILTAQSVLETGYWSSPAWVNKLNPAGIAITDSADLSLTYQNGEESAHAQLVHAYVYVLGPVPDDHLLAPFVPLDPRYHAVIGRGWAGTVRTIADLTHKWATDSQYHSKIVLLGNAVFPNLLGAQPISDGDPVGNGMSEQLPVTDH